MNTAAAYPHITLHAVDLELIKHRAEQRQSMNVGQGRPGQFPNLANANEVGCTGEYAFAKLTGREWRDQFLEELDWQDARKSRADFPGVEVRSSSTNKLPVKKLLLPIYRTDFTRFKLNGVFVHMWLDMPRVYCLGWIYGRDAMTDWFIKEPSSPMKRAHWLVDIQSLEPLETLPPPPSEVDNETPAQPRISGVRPIPA